MFFHGHLLESPGLTQAVWKKEAPAIRGLFFVGSGETGPKTRCANQIDCSQDVVAEYAEGGFGFDSIETSGEEARGSPRDLAIGIDTGEINGPVWSLSGRGTAGALRSSRAHSELRVLPSAGVTVPPWLPAKSARVSNLPACCALGPPACGAQYSCRREPCTGRSAWLPLGRACLSAWIERRSGERRSP
jgi:hypothetical protein